MKFKMPLINKSNHSHQHKNLQNDILIYSKQKYHQLIIDESFTVIVVELSPWLSQSTDVVDGIENMGGSTEKGRCWLNVGEEITS